MSYWLHRVEKHCNGINILFGENRLIIGFSACANNEDFSCHLRSRRMKSLIEMVHTEMILTLCTGRSIMIYGVSVGLFGISYMI